MKHPVNPPCSDCGQPLRQQVVQPSYATSRRCTYCIAQTAKIGTAQ
jgi:hypothetical protein